MDKITERLSAYATGLRSTDLSADTRHQTKRHIIDSLGCALGGFGNEPATVAIRLASQVQSRAPVRILGSARSTSPDMASFVNTILIRYLDCNDTFVSAGGGHPSDMLGAVLAIADQRGAPGASVLTATALAYEIYGRFADIFPTRDKGWDQGLFVVLGSACAAGSLLGLSLEQMAHAISMAVVSNVPLGQTRVGELSMWKGCATAAATRNGVFAALLARSGMEGPAEPFEGPYGLFEQVTGPLEPAPFGRLRDGVPFCIDETSIKYFPAQIHTQAAAAMALELRDQIQLDELETVTIGTYHTACRNAAGEAEKWNPKTRETADHSLPYVVAVALKDGSLTPASFAPDRIQDAFLHRLMKKVSVHEDREFTRQYPAAQGARIELRTRSGRRVFRETLYPKGHYLNPLSDAELESKFHGLTAPMLSERKRQSLLERIWRLETLENLDSVFRLSTLDEARATA